MCVSITGHVPIDKDFLLNQELGKVLKQLDLLACLLNDVFDDNLSKIELLSGFSCSGSQLASYHAKCDGSNLNSTTLPTFSSILEITSDGRGDLKQGIHSYSTGILLYHHWSVWYCRHKYCICVENKLLSGPIGGITPKDILHLLSVDFSSITPPYDKSYGQVWSGHTAWFIGRISNNKYKQLFKVNNTFQSGSTTTEHLPQNNRHPLSTFESLYLPFWAKFGLMPNKPAHILLSLLKTWVGYPKLTTLNHTYLQLVTVHHCHPHYSPHWKLPTADHSSPSMRPIFFPQTPRYGQFLHTLIFPKTQTRLSITKSTPVQPTHHPNALIIEPHHPNSSHSNRNNEADEHFAMQDRITNSTHHTSVEGTPHPLASVANKKRIQATRIKHHSILNQTHLPHKWVFDSSLWNRPKPP